MAFDRFMIAPLNEGMQKNLRPWLIPDDAFEELNNAYVFRGRIRKRFGASVMNGGVAAAVEQLHTRLRANIGNTPGPLNIPGTATQLQIGQMFSVGNDIFTVFQLGAGVVTLSTNGAIVATINSVVNPNTITFVGAPPATAVYYYPANPVMGFVAFEQAPLNNEITIAFDTQFAYQFIAGGWERLAGEVTPGAAIWAGSNAQFFWGTNWTGALANAKILFVTNFNELEPNFMRRWDGNNWDNFRPRISNAAAPVIQIDLNSARVLLPFKNRLLALNTWESEGPAPTLRNYPNRARWSQIGSPVALDAWRQDIPGKGNAIDCPTTEAIISAQFIKDRLIVFFERSTWELAYTGNQALPFSWQKINTELGVESTFSVVPFDKQILGIANVGIHACNGANVERIDEKIPDTVFQIQNKNDGVFRVYGIRDYYTEMVYWTFPGPENLQVPGASATFPTRVLVYNYKTGSWAFNDDSITAFGYFQNQADLVWSAIEETWDEAEFTWNSAELQEQFRHVIAGNQEGFTFLVMPNIARNSLSLSVTQIAIAAGMTTLTIVNHNLQVDDYILLSNIVGVTNLNNTIYKVFAVDNSNTIRILQPIPFPVGGYLGGGTVTLVSQIDILTKQYNFYQQEGKNAYISKVDFMVDRTSDGQLTVNYYTSSSTIEMRQESVNSGSILGNGVLETSPYATIPIEATQERLWHPVSIQAEGEVIQLQLTHTDEQMRNKDIVHDAMQLHAMIFYAQPVSRLQ